MRMIHACGMTDLVGDLAWSPGLRGGGADGSGPAARPCCATRPWWRRASPGRGCPPATTSSARCATRGWPGWPRSLGTTEGGGRGRAVARAPGRRGRRDRQRADRALPPAGDRGGGSVPRPRRSLACRSGFVGAAESKEALAAHPLRLPSWSCTAGAAGPRSRPPPSTRWRATRSDALTTGRLHRRRRRAGRPRPGDRAGRPADRRAADVVAYHCAAARPQRRPVRGRPLPARPARSRRCCATR